MRLRGGFRARLQWAINEIIDLSLWETTPEYWASSAGSQRDGRENEKWGTRLSDCSEGEKRETPEQGEPGESIKLFTVRRRWMGREEYETEDEREKEWSEDSCCWQEPTGHLEVASMWSVASDIELYICEGAMKKPRHKWSTEGFIHVHRWDTRSLFSVAKGGSLLPCQPCICVCKYS